MKKICSKKTCRLAEQKQDICNFSWNNKKENTRASECKSCESKRKKDKLQKNKKDSNRPNIPIQIKKCSNQDCLVKTDQYINPDDKLSDFVWNNNTNDYYVSCKTCKKQYDQKHYNENQEEKIIYQQLYREENKEKINKCKSIYNKQRRYKDPAYKLRQMASHQVRQLLKSRGLSKNKQSIKNYLPENYFKELKKHIEKLFSHPDNLTADGKVWMNWNNQGIYALKTWNDNDSTTWKWQLDHIIPHSEFTYTSMEDPLFLECWALSNLRPLSAKQNIIEGTNRTRHKKEEIK